MRSIKKEQHLKRRPGGFKCRLNAIKIQLNQALDLAPASDSLQSEPASGASK